MKFSILAPVVFCLNAASVILSWPRTPQFSSAGDKLFSIAICQSAVPASAMYAGELRSLLKPARELCALSKLSRSRGVLA